MIDYLLSNQGYNVFQIIITILLTVSLTITFIYDIFNISPKTYLIPTIELSTFIIALIGISLVVTIHKNTETFYDQNWKQVYTNNIDAKVIIANDIVAGQRLGDKYKLLTVNNQSRIKVEKDDASYSKNVNINKDNIIVNNGELNENSKITKIEYQAITGIQRSLFEHKGTIQESKIDGQLRITIEQDTKQDELKKLFESQN